MEWNQVTLTASPETIDNMCAKLVALGFESFQIEDERDVAAQSPYWDMADEELLEHYKGACRVIVYLPATPDGAESLLVLEDNFGTLTPLEIKEEDWAENWKKYYKPIFIGHNLVIHPAWEPPGEYEGRAVFQNNPGMSFGTGLHASTRLCLTLLETMELAGKKILDIGSGSGILSICALLLGGEKATAIDIDPLATGISQENARSNGVALTALTGDYLTDPSLREKAGDGFDVVVSNIVADVIIALAPLVKNVLAKGGVWISSGIIDTRRAEVLDALAENGFSVNSELLANGWVALKSGEP